MPAFLRMPFLIDSPWAKQTKLLTDFSQTPYADRLKEAFLRLHTEILYDSRVHGHSHIERVLLLGALIAWKIDMSDADTQLLLTACSYHDIGRRNDWVDPAHGRRSAEMLQDPANERLLDPIPPQDRRLVYAMVAAHSVSSAYRAQVADEFQIPAENMERYEKLLSCLKDADNLDRVRIGDLDTRYLRNPISLNLAAFAQDLFWKYNE